MRTIDELISRDIAVYVPKPGLDYLGTTHAELDKRLFRHISKRNTTVPMTYEYYHMSIKKTTRYIFFPIFNNRIFKNMMKND